MESLSTPLGREGDSDEHPYGIPRALQRARRLVSVPIVHQPPGVYFLVYRGWVVYVGQSRKPAARIAAHSADKEFHRAFLIPVPAHDLNAVEGALIRLLKPRLNGPPPAESAEGDAAVLQRYGWSDKNAEKYSAWEPGLRPGPLDLAEAWRLCEEIINGAEGPNPYPEPSEEEQDGSGPRLKLRGLFRHDYSKLTPAGAAMAALYESPAPHAEEKEDPHGVR